MKTTGKSPEKKECLVRVIVDKPVNLMHSFSTDQMGNNFLTINSSDPEVCDKTHDCGNSMVNNNLFTEQQKANHHGWCTTYRCYDIGEQGKNNVGKGGKWSGLGNGGNNYLLVNFSGNKINDEDEARGDDEIFVFYNFREHEIYFFE